MKATLEQEGPCRKVIRVNATPEEVIPEYDRVVGEFARVARVPGFRKGKAPAGVIARRFEKEVEDTTRERLVPRMYREALEQRGITPVAIVDVSDVLLKRDLGLQFTVTVDVAPDFKLPKYTRIGLRRQPVEVSDEQVEETYQRFLDNFSRFEEVTGREVREGDMVCIDYSGVCEGRPVQEIAGDCAGLGEQTGFWMLCGRDPIPGFSEGLKGMSVGESKEITVDFPADHAVPAVAGKQAVYTVSVTGMRERRKPEITEEFLKRFEVDSEEALKRRVREDLEKAAEQQEQDRLKDEISKHLLAKTKLDVPQAIVEQERNLTLRSMINRIVRQGATREDIESHQDELVKSAEEFSVDRVKLSYIFSRIADEEGIGVQDEELDARVQALAGQYRTTPERLRSELEKQNGMAGLKSDLRAEKTLDWLLENAKVKG